jgi:hypothetical protein
MAAGRVFLESSGLTAARTAASAWCRCRFTTESARGDNWATTADLMEARTCCRVTRTTCACWTMVLIANTDRHYGNISLLLEGRLGVVTDLCAANALRTRGQ